MAQKQVLLLGGHGKIALHLTPLLLRSHNLTSVIRNPDHKADILEAGKNGQGKLDVLVESLADIKSQSDAQKVLDRIKPDWVVWSAGAGGKGGASTTYAIDRDACQAFIRASIATPSVKKFLLVTALNIRRNKAPWWSDETWEQVTKVNTEVMPDYYKAKRAADDVLTVLGEERRKKDSSFKWIALRPGLLKDGDPFGKIELGRTTGKGDVQRADVADVAARLLETEANGWYDLTNGDTETAKAVETAVQGGVAATAIEGEDVEEMKKSL